MSGATNHRCPLGRHFCSSWSALVLLWAVVVFALLTPDVIAQPISQHMGTSTLPLSGVERFLIPGVDREALWARDALLERGGEELPLRFAEPLDLTLSPETHGTWELLGDGTRLWRLRVEAPGAYSLNVGFYRFRLPKGAALWLYPTDGEPPFKAFTAVDNDERGQLWTPVILGDELVIELNLPPTKAPFDYELEVGRIGRGYRPITTSRTLEAGGRSEGSACYVDIACPEGELYPDAARSVGVYTRSGEFACTGAAVNNTSGDGTPYFLTAQHCDVDADNAPSIVVYWNFENSTCRPPGSAENAEPGDGMLTQFNTGATFLGSGESSDWALIRLDEAPLSEYDVFLAGWDRSEQPPIGAVGIHHPQGQEKRISIDEDALAVTTYRSDIPTPDGTHLRVGAWEVGSTGTGSSGSPLFSTEGLVVGQLHGGNAACGNDLSDWYGWMARSMESGLAQWLDPLGAGIERLGGRDAVSAVQASMTFEPSVVTPGAITALTVRLSSAAKDELTGVAFTHSLPAPLAYVGDGSASSGGIAVAGGDVHWSGDIGEGDVVVLSYTLETSDDLPSGVLTTSATVEHTASEAALTVGAAVDISAQADFVFTNDDDLPISDAGCPSFESSTLSVPDSFLWSDLDVGVVVEHPWRGDLRLQLTSPAGTVVSLLDRPGNEPNGTGADNLDALFSDTGPEGEFGTSRDHELSHPHYDNPGRLERGVSGSGPAGTLSALRGEDPRGEWVLNVCDGAQRDVGHLLQWSLLFSSAGDGMAEGNAFIIEPPHPNPFSGETVVLMTIREAQNIRVEVFNALGRRVRVLHDGWMQADAPHALRFGGSDLSSGIYFVCIMGNSFSESLRTVLIR